MLRSRRKVRVEHREPFYREPGLQRACPHPSTSTIAVSGSRATPALPPPQPFTSLGQKSIASGAPTASASALRAKPRQEGEGRETLLQFPAVRTPFHPRALASPGDDPRSPGSGRGLRRAARQVSRPTWRTCEALPSRLRALPPRAPSSSGYLRKLTRERWRPPGTGRGPPPHPDTSRASLQVRAPQSLLPWRGRRRGWPGGERRMSRPLGPVAPQDLKVGGNACSPHTSSLLLGWLFPLKRLSREVGREEGEKEAARLPGGGSSRSAGRATSAGAGGTGL